MLRAGLLRRRLTTCQTDKASIEIIQPGSQYGSAIPIGIGGDKNHLNLFPDLRRQLLQAVSTKYRCHRLCHLQMSLLDGGVGRRVGAEPAA